MAIKHETPAMRLANQLRENPAQFIQQTVHPEGVFHTTGFKEYLETGNPFILYLEEADRPYVQVDYWTVEKSNIILHQLLASACVPVGETECRQVANAHHRDIYHLPNGVVGLTQPFMRNMALDIWECIVNECKEKFGTRQEAWLFPLGLNTPTFLHVSNYQK